MVCFLLKSNFKLPRDLESRFLDFRETFKDMVLKTENRLYIASYVFTPNFPLFEDLKKLQRRNIDIRLLLDSESQSALPVVGVFPTKVITGNTLHMKFAVADGNKCILGSHNMTYSASEKNYEIGIYAKGEMCSDLERLFLYLWDSDS